MKFPFASLVCVKVADPPADDASTSIVKVFTSPVQLMLPLVKVGVTAIVAVIGVVPLFTAVKERIFPFPEAANPIEAVLLVQEYVVDPPEFMVAKLTTVVGLPLQTT